MKGIETLVLVNLSVSQWGARVGHKAGAQRIEAEANATQGSVNVTKHLMVSADAALKKITAQAQNTRRVLEKHTLPWDDAGYRACSAAQLFTLRGELEIERIKFGNLVEQFLIDYPRLRDGALANLGSLANPDDYPPVPIMRRKFAMHISTTPIQSTVPTALREQLTAEQASIVEADVRKTMAAQASTALRGAWERLERDARRLAERLAAKAANDKARLHDSSITTLRETAQVLDGANVFGDETLTAQCRRVLAVLDGINAPMLSASSTKMAETRAKVDSLVADLSAFI